MKARMYPLDVLLAGIRAVIVRRTKGPVRVGVTVMPNCPKWKRDKAQTVDIGKGPYRLKMDNGEMLKFRWYCAYCKLFY